MKIIPDFSYHGSEDVNKEAVFLNVIALTAIVPVFSCIHNALRIHSLSVLEKEIRVGKKKIVDTENLRSPTGG